MKVAIYARWEENCRSLIRLASKQQEQTSNLTHYRMVLRLPRRRRRSVGR
jgi:hypothetical protein